ncbi:MAG: dienelactone hydrolase family protein [Burkholderiaceae bacterium]|nr:dienelactone hydrolase family protein [Burkholderiaceae bacterium]
MACRAGAEQNAHSPRRQFVKTSLAAGFAAAVSPIELRAVIHTDASALIAGELRIPTSSGPMPAYRAKPDKGDHLPTLLVVHEIFGVHEHIRDVCRRFAKLGYLAIAPDLFARYGDASAISDMQALMRDIVSKVPDSEVLSDLDRTARWAAENGGDPERQGVTGFCWGGRITWLYAAAQPRLKAAAAWYGQLIGEPSANRPRHPIDLAASLKVPVLGLYGGADAGIPLDTIERMKAALASAPVRGAESRFIVYPDAPHAFFADYRPNYREQAAHDAWARCHEWFVRHGLS